MGGRWTLRQRKFLMNFAKHLLQNTIKLLPKKTEDDSQTTGLPDGIVEMNHSMTDHKIYLHHLIKLNKIRKLRSPKLPSS